MSSSLFDIELLVSQHQRTDFTCGVEALDTYFRKQVGQDVRNRVTKCYVAVEVPTGIIAGFYTLAAGNVNVQDVPEPVKKRLPRYPAVPVALLGRMAVSEKYQGQKLGAALISDAIERVKNSPMAAFALVVDAKDDKAASFYLYHDFIPYGSNHRQLILRL